MKCKKKKQKEYDYGRMEIRGRTQRRNKSVGKRIEINRRKEKTGLR